MRTDTRTPEDRALRAAVAVTGLVERRPALRRAVPAVVWLAALGMSLAGCDGCAPSWGPTAPPEAES
jgi:hypothetical protein